MLGDEALDAVLQLVGQALVGGVHVAEQRVAAGLWYLDRPQDRPLRRHLTPGDVVVPAVLVPTGVGVLGEADQLGTLVVVAQERVDLELPEPPREGDVLLGSELLVAEEQHLVVDPRPCQFLEHVVGERLRQIETLDDAAERGTDLTNLEVFPLQRRQADAFGGEMGDRADECLVRSEPELARVELADVAGRLDPLQLGDRRVRGLQVVVGDAHLGPSIATPIAAEPKLAAAVRPAPKRSWAVPSSHGCTSRRVR